MATDLVLANSLFKDAAMFGKLQRSVADVLGPSGLDLRRFIVLAQRSVVHNPRLLQCTALSVAASILEAAIWGLEVGGQAGQAYLVPFNNMIEGPDGKKHKLMECTLQVGYKGFETVAWREAKILMPSACVYDGDRFEVQLGSAPSILHVPKLRRESDGRRLIATYALGIFPDGRSLVAVHDLAEIERRRKCSKAGDGDAWTRFYDAMARKGPVRQLGSTQIPYSFAPRLQEMAATDEYREGGIATQLPEAAAAATDIVGGSKPEMISGNVLSGDETAPQDSAAAPRAASAGWFPKEPSNDCTVGPLFFESKDSFKSGKYTVFSAKTADGENYSTFDRSLYEALPTGRTILAAWTAKEKDGKSYKNLAAIQPYEKA